MGPLIYVHRLRCSVPFFLGRDLPLLQLRSGREAGMRCGGILISLEDATALSESCCVVSLTLRCALDDEAKNLSDFVRYQRQSTEV